MYLAVATRPDIANTVSRLALHINNPHTEHWSAAKRVLRYLSTTSDLALVYTRMGEPIQGFSDTDWTDDWTIDRHSYIGHSYYVYLLGGPAISWRSQKQRTIALSSTEADISLSETAKEATYLRSLMHEIGMNKYGEIVFSVDNLAALYTASDSVHHARTKHIDVRCHFVREKVTSGKLELKHVPTTHMTANILTKAPCLARDVWKNWSCKLPTSMIFRVRFERACWNRRLNLPVTSHCYYIKVSSRFSTFSDNRDNYHLIFFSFRYLFRYYFFVTLNIQNIHGSNIV